LLANPLLKLPTTEFTTIVRVDPFGSGWTLLGVDLVDGVDDGLVDCVLGLVEVNKYHLSGLINPNHHVSTVS
jgi:hypothetical protein